MNFGFVLLTNEEFTEYEGRKNIGNTKSAKAFLKLIKDGSKKIEERIKGIEADKKEDIKRITPATRGNIQTFKQAGGAGGAGIQVAGGRGQVGRRI